jgi:hypothetical protein
MLTSRLSGVEPYWLRPEQHIVVLAGAGQKIVDSADLARPKGF